MRCKRVLDSSGIEELIFSVSRSATDILSAVQTALSQFSTSRVLLTGHSLGMCFLSPLEAAVKDGPVDIKASLHRRRDIAPALGLHPAPHPECTGHVRGLWPAPRREPSIRGLRRRARLSHPRDAHQQHGGPDPHTAWTFSRLPSPIGRDPHPGLARVGGVRRPGQHEL